MQHQTLQGIFSSVFQIGGRLGSKLFSRNAGIDARDAVDTAYVPIRAASADGTVGSQLTTYDDVVRLLPSSLTLYPTTTLSDITGYKKLVCEINDPDYDDVAQDVATGAITGQAQLITSLVTDNEAFQGNPGIINIFTIGNIRRTSGTGTACFFYKLFHRDTEGTETEITESNCTVGISTASYAEFYAGALLNNGSFGPLDRIVLKFYANRVAGGTDPTYDLQFGGSTPMRTTISVPYTALMKDLTLYVNDPLLSISARENPLITRTCCQNKFGENSDISTAGNEDIWDVGGLWVPPTAPRIHNIVSTSASDIGVLRSSGVVDTSTTTTLTDASATFITDGVAVGDTVINDDNFDHSTVTARTETTLTFAEGTIHANDPTAIVSGFSAGENYRVVSATSTGVSIVHLYGLDSNMDPLEEFVIMNGLTNVPTISQFYRIFRMHSDGAASRTVTNVGNISATAQTDGTVTAQVNPGNGTTGMAIYTVPRGKTAYMTSVYADVVKPGSVASSVSMTLRSTPLASIDGAGSRVSHYFGLNDTGSSSYNHKFIPYKAYLEKTDIWIRCEECSASGTAVSAGFDLILVDNA